MEINIGGKLRSLRQKNNLTQKELADRCELSKGFISQLESNQTSPSLSTLEDILTTLGSSFHEFFSDEQGDNPVCRKEDVFIKENDGVTIHWLIPNAQKKDIEPIMVTLQPGSRTETDPAAYGRGIRSCACRRGHTDARRQGVSRAQGGQLFLQAVITALFGKHGQDPGDGALGLHSAEFLRRTFHG